MTPELPTVGPSYPWYDDRFSYALNLVRAIGEGSYGTVLNGLILHLTSQAHLPLESWQKRAASSLQTVDSDHYQRLRLANICFLLQACKESRSRMYFFQRVHYLWLLEQVYWKGVEL